MQWVCFGSERSLNICVEICTINWGMLNFAWEIFAHLGNRAASRPILAVLWFATILPPSLVICSVDKIRMMMMMTGDDGKNRMQRDI